MANSLADLVKRLEVAVTSIESLVGGGPAHPPPVDPSPSQPTPAAKAPQVSPLILSYESSILSKIPALQEVAAKIDPQIVNLTTLLHQAYSFNRTFIEWTLTHKRPSEDELKAVQARVSEIIKKVGDLKDSRNPLNGFYLFGFEVAQAVLWIISPMPAPTAESFIETSSFYGNRILKEKQEHQVVWVKGFNEIVKANVAYVKENFLNGILWNASGKNFSEALNAAGPKVEEVKVEAKPKVEEEKKVVKQKKEPKKFERGISWIFENFENDKTLQLPEGETGMKKAVLIDKCVGCVFQIHGKVKSIIMSDCKNTSLVFQSLVSGIEIINCDKLQIQSTGMIPSLSIDKTSDIKIYLTRECLNEVMISNSQSNDMVLVTPGDDPDGDSVEIPIPHQFVHRFVKGKITCAASELYG